MAGHDLYCYWDASFPSRSFDVYGQDVNRHWDFPAPGPQFSGHLIPSCILGWPLSVQKAWTLFGLHVLHEMLRLRAIFLNESSIAMCCRRLSNEGQSNTLTCVLVQQTLWSFWCLQIWTDRVLPRGSPWIKAAFPLHRVSCHGKQIMNIVTTYAALALMPYSVRTALKSTVCVMYTMSMHVVLICTYCVALKFHKF